MEYLFTAYYNDGTYYKQNKEDKSILEPDKRSCFYDIDHSKLIGFELSNGNNVYYVDLITGEITCTIESNETILKNKDTKLTNYRIIYYRGTEVAMNYIFGDGRKTRIVNYTIGWQAIDENGKNVQHKIEIKV